MQIKKPMKGDSANDSLHLLKFPLFVSPKLDGFRCLKLNGKALSSSLKPIRNAYTRNYIEQYLPDNIDGELMLADKSAKFTDISSAFSSHDGEPDFVFHAFDLISDKPFNMRHGDITKTVITTKDERLQLVIQTTVHNLDELLQFESDCLADGYEGIMIRSITGPYKSGKSTVKEGWLLKLKRFVDSDAEIISFIEEMTNNNEKVIQETGRSKRSSKQANKAPAGTLGGFAVRDIHSGVEFEVGTGQGLTDALRQEIWDNQAKYKDLLIKYKYQQIGTKDKPRQPVWLGFRPREDIS